MSISPSQPIGLFDSGVGGLTVAHAIRSVLPHERLIYFGDTFHLPYGDKSSDSVKYYSTRISDFLLEKDCKVILIACNTASASAYQEVRDHVGNRAVVVNVVDPVVAVVGGGSQDGQPGASDGGDGIADGHANVSAAGAGVSDGHANVSAAGAGVAEAGSAVAKERIGVIGTKGTINSRTYPEKLAAINPGMDVVSMATPLLVPMIEEGFVFDDISRAIIRAYLSDPVLEGITGLILGCTHYPIIKRQIEKYYDFNVNVIDSAAIVARSLKKLLEDKGLLNAGESGPDHFYVSDYTEYFGKIARLFFEEDLELEQIDFWK